MTLAEGNILSKASLSNALPRDTSVVFHLAADTSLWSKANARQTRINVVGTRNVIEVALEAGVERFIHTSSFGVYGFDSGKISEDAKKRGLSSWINYAKSKALAEREVQKGVEDGLEAIVINPPHVIGKYDVSNWSRMIVMIHENRLPGIPPGYGTFSHAEQVASAHISAVTEGNVGENYLLGGVDASFSEVVQVIGNVTNRTVPDEAMSPTLLKVIGHVQNLMSIFTGEEPDLTPEGAEIVTSNTRVVSEKAERELDYKTVPLRTMIIDCYKYLKSEGVIS